MKTPIRIKSVITLTVLMIDFIKKAIIYEIAEHENTYHLDSDCTPVEERKAMEEAERKLHEGNNNTTWRLHYTTKLEEKQHEKNNNQRKSRKTRAMASST